MWAFEEDLQKKGIKCIAGVDEVGVGPWAGPVIAGACILKTTQFECRITDSKQLTEKQRERAYTEIIEKAFIGLGIVSCEMIDQINVFQAACLAAQKAVDALPLVPEYLLIEGRLVLPNNYIPFQNIIDGDSKSFTIACASIVAKVTRDRMMKEMDMQYPGYGFGKHKGYGTAVHQEALKKLGPCPIHRKSFRPIAECVQRLD